MQIITHIKYSLKNQLKMLSTLLKTIVSFDDDVLRGDNDHTLHI